MADHTMQPDTVDDAGRPLLDFRRYMDGEGGLPYFVGIRVPKETFLETGTDAIVTFIVAMLWLSTLTRYDTPKDARRPFVFVHNEPHQSPSSLAIIRAMVSIWIFRAFLIFLNLEKQTSIR